jgi:hypothetical protein
MIYNKYRSIERELKSDGLQQRKTWLFVHVRIRMCTPKHSGVLARWARNTRLWIELFMAHRRISTVLQEEQGQSAIIIGVLVLEAKKWVLYNIARS